MGSDGSLTLLSSPAVHLYHDCTLLSLSFLIVEMTQNLVCRVV